MPRSTYPDDLAEVRQRITELVESRRFEAAVSLCDQVVTRFGTECTEDRIRLHVVYARARKALALAELGRLQDAVQTTDALVADSGRDENETIQLLTAIAAHAIVSRARELDENALALTLCERYAPALTGEPDDALPEQTVQLIGLFAALLAESGRTGEALTRVDQFLALAAANPSPELAEQLDNAMGLKETLTEYADWMAQLGKPYGEDHAEVKVALLGSRGSWLVSPAGPGPVEAEIAFMRSCAALYDHLRANRPDLAGDSGALNMLQEIATETIRAATGSRMADARAGSWGLSDGVAEAVAAARLTAAGESRAVNVTASIMSQGLECAWPWTRQPGTVGHLWLLPAISSALSPDEAFAGDALGRDVPPCFYSDGLRILLWPEPWFRGLRPDVPDEDRRRFVNWALGEKANRFNDDGEPDHQFMLSDWATVFDVGPGVAAALGIDPETVTCGVNDRLDEWLAGLDGVDRWSAEPEECDLQAAIEVAHLIYWVASEAHLLVDAGDDLALVAHDHPWVVDWYPTTMPWAVWPPDRDVLLEALRAERPTGSPSSDEPGSAERLRPDAEAGWRAAQAMWTTEASFNVESGNATVNVSVSYPSCGCFDEGPDGHTQPDCETCGRPAGSRFAVGSGAGDGVYPVYRLSEDPDGMVHGAIAIFDEQLALQLECRRSGPWELVRHADPVHLGEVRSEGSLTFCEAFHGADRDNAAVEVALPEGTFQVVAWMGEVTAYGMSWGYRTQALAVYDEPTMHGLDALTAVNQSPFEADE